jgi:hypothetical protein
MTTTSTAQAETAELSPGQIFARAHGKTAVADMLKTIKWSKHRGRALVIGYIVASFFHQCTFLMGIGMDWIGAIILPMMFDVAIYQLAGVISTIAMNKAAKNTARWIIILPAGASALVNFIASPNMWVGVVYVLGAVMVVAIKVNNAQIGPDFQVILAEEAKTMQMTGTQTGRKLDANTAQQRADKAATTREIKAVFGGMSHPQLVQECKNRGVARSGTKDQLVARIVKFERDLRQMQKGHVPANAPTSPAMV